MAQAVNVHFNCFIDLTIIPIQIPIIWLPVGCCDQFSRGIQMVTHMVGFVGRRIFPPYVFLVYTNGTLGDQNFCTLLLKRLKS